MGNANTKFISMNANVFHQSEFNPTEMLTPELIKTKCVESLSLSLRKQGTDITEMVKANGESKLLVGARAAGGHLLRYALPDGAY